MASIKFSIFVLCLLVCFGNLLSIEANGEEFQCDQVSPDNLECTEVTSNLPFFDHVIVIMMENTGRPNITGNKKYMPYINELIEKEMYADHYHGYTNPSLPNYIAITAGSQYWSFSDNPDQVFPHTNIADLLEERGMTWKSYAQSLPYTGYLGYTYPDDYAAVYVKKHVPFAFYPQITNNASRLKNIVPYEEILKDLEQGTLPSYSFITPDVCHDMHGQYSLHVEYMSSIPEGGPSDKYCPFNDYYFLWKNGDNFVKGAITNITQSKVWKESNSVIFLTWDQAEVDFNQSTDGWQYVTAGPDSPVLFPGTVLLPAGGVYGGGPVPLIALWSKKPNHHVVYRESSNHLFTLKTILKAWNLPYLGFTSDEMQIKTFDSFFH
ncbi:hypothetical protein GpartN1_g3494.t1 [Galdieria partita]|uniref:Acid phosphatase n=1 Tax=Galdieria partita TaxID=83374 RepID=A0A9C7PVL5_9RHOD|nr:hypothetical protein GpartN1_g3494.t1 [Galdieria partita]